MIILQNLCRELFLFNMILLGYFQFGAKNWKTCKRNDPKINECLKPAIQDAIGDLMKGVPSLSLLPLDPLHLIKLDLSQGGSSNPVAINLTFIETDIIGFKSAKLSSIDINWDKGTMRGLLDLADPVQLVGDYKANGKVLLLPINGHGKCNFTLSGAVAVLEGTGKYEERQGKKYFKLETFTVDITHKKVYMKMENLFNGDKTLGDNMNKFLNENSEEVFGAFKETLLKGLSEAFKSIATRVFDKVPLDVIAPL